MNIYAVGSNPASLNFGGDLTAGELVTTELKLYVKRDPGYAYSTIQISSDNLSQTAQSSSWVNATADTVGSDTVITLGGTDTFNSTNSEVGKAVSRAGVFIGVIASNTSNTATILGVTGVTAAAAIYTIYTVGELWVANDNGSNAPGTYRKVLQGAMDVPGIPSTIDDNTVYPIWVKGTVPLPINATNYAENVIKVSATEFLA